LRLCFIASGVSIHTKRWVNYFAQKGHEVHLISSSFDDVREGFDSAIQMHPLIRLLPQIWKLSGYLSGVLWLFQVRRLVNKIKPDILHAHYIGVPAYLGVASGFHPLVLTAWGSDILINPKQSPLRGILNKYTLKKADLITSDAEHLIERLIELEAGKEKIELVYFGVDTQKFCPTRKDEKLREELNIFDSPTIISTRSLKPIYDIESLINAMPLVLEETPNAKFIIAGDGDQRGYLEELTRSLGVWNSVRFVGWLQEDELSKYYNSSDIYISTSLSDAGLAAGTAEAMACGLPVIITDFGNNRNWVQDGKNGFIVPVRNPKVIASKIIYLLRNNDDRISYGTANQHLIEEKNNREREMGRMQKLYKELIERQ